jgi:AraC family transcriptional regulator
VTHSGQRAVTQVSAKARIFVKIHSLSVWQISAMRKTSPWSEVRKQLGHVPVVEGAIGGDSPLYCERYVYQTAHVAVSPQPFVGLIAQLGGARVREGERDHWRSENLPSQSMLLPANVATHWHYAGTVDFAIFYFMAPRGVLSERLAKLSEGREEPLSLVDALVNAAALQLVAELQRGSHADAVFMTKLAEIMLEQSYRALTTTGARGIHPRHVHFARLQAVLNLIHEHLSDDLCAERLAAHAGVSLAHFRRIFDDAMGMPPHRYILGVRLEQARQLLGRSSLPIAGIAQECGFSSQSHLTACFRREYACTPAEYRQHLRPKP